MNNGRPNVLIVNEPGNVKLLSAMLAPFDMEAKEASCVREALEMVNDFEFDAIFLDVHMQDMNGISACRKLKENEKTLNIPILFLTAYDDVESHALDMRRKEDAWLFSVSNSGKPIPAEYHQNIFDKFSQVEVRESTGRKGVGLGLAFCRMAIEAMGGTISVESPIDGRADGTRFVFSLPSAGGNDA